MMYKIMNNLVDVPTDAILFPSTLQLRGHKDSATILQSQCICQFLYSHMQSINYKLWNDLPQDI